MNSSCDSKIFANSWPSASNFNSFSRSLWQISHSSTEQFWKQSNYYIRFTYHFFQVSEPFRYKNKQIKHGEGLLSIEQARLPFNIALESLKSFNLLSSGYNYSSTGMRIHFKRNTFGLLVGGYYGPTIIFTLLSLVSYTINADMVSMDFFQSLKTMK